MSKQPAPDLLALPILVLYMCQSHESGYPTVPNVNIDPWKTFVNVENSKSYPPSHLNFLHTSTYL